jgi:outer membrane lipoprotein-sorting protein
VRVRPTSVSSPSGLFLRVVEATKHCLCLTALLALVAPPTRAQHAEYMDPDQSAAKAKQVLQQLIAALGGPAYLQMKSSECDGRYANFGHNGETNGYTQAKNFWNYPDKLRVEYGKKGNIVDLYTGDQGWTLDRGGVSEEPATSVSDFEEGLKRNINYLLRVRLNEPGLLLRYGGTGVDELREVEWVEVTDTEERTFRIAMDRSTHLPVKTIVRMVDNETRERIEDVTIYTNFQAKEGVQMPMQVSRHRDGRRISQAFFDSCQVNPNLPTDFFTKESLEKRFKEVGGKKKD